MNLFYGGIPISRAILGGHRRKTRRRGTHKRVAHGIKTNKRKSRWDKTLTRNKNK